MSEHSAEELGSGPVPAAQSHAGSVPVVWAEAADYASSVVVACAPSTAKRLLRLATPVFDDAGVDVVSFSIDRHSSVHMGSARSGLLRGTFLVTDENGAPLDTATTERLLLALREVLPHPGESQPQLTKSDSMGSNMSTTMDTPPLGGSTPGGQQTHHQPSAVALHALHDHLMPHVHAQGVQHRRMASGMSTDGDMSEAMLLDRMDSGPSLQSRQSSQGGVAGVSSSHGVPPVHPHPQGYHGHSYSEATVASPRSASILGRPGSLEVYSSCAGLAASGSLEGVRSSFSGGPGTGSSTGAVAVAEGSSGALVGGGPSSLAEEEGPCGCVGLEEECSEMAVGQRVVDSIMTTPVHHVHRDTDLGTAKLLMARWGVSALLVDMGPEPPGFLTKRDFLKVSFARALKTVRVSDVMAHPVIAIPSGTTLRDAVGFLAAKGVRRVPVHDARAALPGQPMSAYVGVVSDTDIFRVLSRAGQPAPSSTEARSTEGGGSAGTTVAGASGGVGGPSPPSEHSVRSGPGLHHYQSNMSTASGLSMGSLAQSISSVSEQAKHLSMEERYHMAAALWELDFNELEVIRKIGAGSFGEVLLANFRGTKVAVKRMRGFEMGPDNDEPGPSPTMMPVFAEFFEREIELMASIRHPNVVNFIGACHTPPNVCLVTEYCARGSLDHLLHKSGLHLDLVKRIEFAMDITRGMSCLHAQRPAIIHRDLKPANLLVSARFEVKVADMGLSRIKDHAQLTNSRAGLEGTVEYCAPEVLRGEPYSEKCDVWSFAVVLWELLNRQRPYADTDSPVYILMMALGTGSMRLPPVREEVCSPGLVKLVERCMAWNPSDRPSFREILHLLEHEYKAARGKAAAVPRSDSASSMVVMGNPMQHSESSADVGTRAALSAGVPTPAGSAAGAARGPGAPPVVVAHALGAGGRPASAGPPPRRAGPGSQDGGHHSDTVTPAVSADRHSPHVASRFAPVGRSSHPSGALQAPPGASAVGAARVPAVTPHAGPPTPPRSGRHGAGAPGAHAPGYGPGRPPRHPHPRMSRARSTPLPAQTWFHDPADWDDDDQGVSSDSGHALMEPAQVPVSATSAPSPDLPSTSVPLPVPGTGRLSNIPEVGSWGEGFDSGSTLGGDGPPSLTPGAQPPPPSFGDHLLAVVTGVQRSGNSNSSAGGSELSLLQRESLSTGMAGSSARGLALPPPASSPFAVLSGKLTQQQQQQGFTSPFDGFLPFTEEPDSPDTPRVGGLDPDASAASPAASADATLLVHGTPPAGAAAGKTGNFTSPFAAPPGFDDAPAPAPKPQEAVGHRTGNFMSPFADLPPFDDTPADAAAPAAEVVPVVVPVVGHKTGNFVSPFADLPAFGDDEGDDNALVAAPALGAGEPSPPGSGSAPLDGVAPVPAVITSSHASRRESGALPTGVGAAAAGLGHLVTHMSVSLSMDAHSPGEAGQDVLAGGAELGPASPATTGALGIHRRQSVEMGGGVETTSGRPAMLMRRASLNTAGGAAAAVLGGAGSHSAGSGRASLDKTSAAKAGGAAEGASGAPGETDVAVHQTWVHV